MSEEQNESLWDIINEYYAKLLVEFSRGIFEQEKAAPRNVLFLFANRVIDWKKKQET